MSRSHYKHCVAIFHKCDIKYNKEESFCGNGCNLLKTKENEKINNQLYFLRADLKGLHTEVVFGEDNMDNNRFILYVRGGCRIQPKGQYAQGMYYESLSGHKKCFEQFAHFSQQKCALGQVVTIPRRCSIVTFSSLTISAELDTRNTVFSFSIHLHLFMDESGGGIR